MRGGRLTRRTRLRAVSDRREAEKALRRTVVAAAMIRDRSTCQARERVPHLACFGPLDPHEIIPRSAWRAGYLEIDNVIIVCRHHHQWIDDHPRKAHDVGLHGFSYERPDHSHTRER